MMKTQINEETLKEVRQIYRREKRRGKTAWEAMKEALESVPDTFGMEGFQMKNSRTGIYYANTGETYATTVIAWHNERLQRTVFKLGSWGDLVETDRCV